MSLILCDIVALEGTLWGAAFSPRAPAALEPPAERCRAALPLLLGCKSASGTKHITFRLSTLILAGCCARDLQGCKWHETQHIPALNDLRATARDLPSTRHDLRSTIHERRTTGNGILTTDGLSQTAGPHKRLCNNSSITPTLKSSEKWVVG